MPWWTHFFDPPPPPKKRISQEEAQDPTDMPYTSMFVGAVSMGFSTEDLRTMPLNRLLWFIHVHNLNSAPKSDEPKPRKGTVDELKRIL